MGTRVHGRRRRRGGERCRDHTKQKPTPLGCREAPPPERRGEERQRQTERERERETARAHVLGVAILALAALARGVVARDGLGLEGGLAGEQVGVRGDGERGHEEELGEHDVRFVYSKDKRTQSSRLPLGKNIGPRRFLVFGCSRQF